MPLNIEGETLKNPKLSLFYSAQFLAASYFWVGIAVPYLLYRGLSPAQALSLLSLYQLFGVALEYPTGVMGDRYGYRRVLYLGNFFNFLAMVVMILPGGYFVYLLALVLLALGNGLCSGNDMGVLKAVSTNIKKDTGNYNALLDLTFSLSAVMGGILSQISYELALSISGGLMLVANLPLYLLKDGIQQTKTTQSLVLTVRDGFKSLQNPIFKQLFIITGLFGGYAYTIKTIFGSFGSQFHINVATISVLIGLSGLLRALGGKLYAEWPTTNMLGVSLVIGLAVLATGIFPTYVPVVIFTLLTQLLSGYLGSKMDADIHDLASDHVRASLFSLKRLLIRISASSYLLLYGLALDMGKFSLVMVGIGGILLVGVIFSWYYLTSKYPTQLNYARTT
jgi:MFS family permease